jgi:hypothetical protein
MRGAYTGSLHAPSALATLRPTFRWAPVATTCGSVTYEFEADDSCGPGRVDTCDFPSLEVDAQGIVSSTFTPPQDLKVAATPPVGAFYVWRVRACVGTQCGPWSESRYLHVGRVREDINGDGYGDLLAMSSRGIEVYLGSSQFNPSSESDTIAYSGAVPPTFSGDVNGDGYADFFGMTTYIPSSGFAPTLYLGGPDVTALGTVILTKTAGGPSTMMLTTSAGDLNGDGFADLIVQWGYLITTPQTELRIFFGGASLSNTPDLSIPGPYVSDYTLQHSGHVGDLNSDGYEDIALTAYDGPSGTGVIEIFAGGLHPQDVPAASVSTTASSYEVSSAGDVNGDGIDDAAVVQSGTAYYLYEGTRQLQTVFAATWADSTARSVTGGFDIDRDGFADFAIGTSAQAALLYRGTASGSMIVPQGLGLLTRSTVIGFSDHDGDSRPDIVGAGDSSSGVGDIYVEWAGSDGTTNPRILQLRLSDLKATFTGAIVR